MTWWGVMVACWFSACFGFAAGAYYKGTVDPNNEWQTEE